MIRYIFLILLTFPIMPLVAQEVNDSTAYITVEVPPRFPGGENELYKYIGQNLKYPNEAREKGFQGTVVLHFIVEKDGSISSARVIKGEHASLNEEALRVVNSFPKWEPGTQRGKKVRVQFVLPIRFVLQDSGDKKERKKTKSKRN